MNVIKLQKKNNTYVQQKENADKFEKDNCS